MGIIYKDALASGQQSWWDGQPEDKRPLTPESYGAALVPLLKPLGLWRVVPLKVHVAT